MSGGEDPHAALLASLARLCSTLVQLQSDLRWLYLVNIVLTVLLLFLLAVGLIGGPG